MTADLSHWDFAEQFTAFEAAALILGIEPRTSSGSEWRINVVVSRMASSFRDAETAALYCKHKTLGQTPIGALSSIDLLSFRDLCEADLLTKSDWAGRPGSRTPGKLNKGFDAQLFSRPAIVQWLAEIEMGSVYQFDRSTGARQSVEDIDPGDLPEELHAANIAFRAVSNGHGDQSATFKNRLTAYLQESFKHLGSEAIGRIATVANPDKSRGRKSRNAE